MISQIAKPNATAHIPSSIASREVSITSSSPEMTSAMQSTSHISEAPQYIRQSVPSLYLLFFLVLYQKAVVIAAAIAVMIRYMIPLWRLCF